MSNEIKCPNCGEVFKVSEAGYAAIVKQVRDNEFDADIRKRESELASQLEVQFELEKKQIEDNYSKKLSGKEQELAALKGELSKADQEKEIAVMKAVGEIEENYSKKLSGKEQELVALKGELSKADQEKEIAVMKAVGEKETEINQKAQEISNLEAKINLKEKEYEIEKNSLITAHANELKLKDDEIDFYKDFKARQSTKMIGESLEQHCLTTFNRLRATAFPTAYFEKDNDASSGEKGDFIYRETDEDGVELISIMFEMKNEMDETATKHKNEDFFKKLDRDRKTKNCEYAVLVSMLEADNDFYNDGIADVSYAYDKMYVIRPQFFIPLITILRNAAKNSMKYKQELEARKREEIDLTNFMENVESFKEACGNNYRLAGEHFQKAIDQIDKSIAALQKTKEFLTKSENQLRLANDKAQGDLTVKKLTKNAPAIKALLEEQSR